jgi:hypothetical protein
MKRSLVFLLICINLILFSSCSKPEKRQEISQADVVTAVVENTAQPKEPTKAIDTTSVFGAYVGQFVAEKYHEERNISYTNLISIFIDSMHSKQLFGHSVVAGNNTPFTGQYSRTGRGIYHAEVREPGSGKYDGVFHFDLDSAANQLKGRWIANDTSIGVFERTFELTKRYFKYDPQAQLPEEFASMPVADFTTSDEEDEGSKAESTTEDVLKFNPSTTLLSTKDVENMRRGDLEVLRNAIYARHGYAFRNRNMRVLFDNVEWYMPVSTDIREELTEIERKNVALLKRYEEHAERYYDYFGR